ncbi:MAG: response regulator [Chitinophagales bacterium]|nr:response regulator [Chitinophagales bacterium]
MLVHRFVAAITLLGLSMLLHAQAPLDFVKYATTDGLPGNHVAYVYADPEGFVWASTGRGIARFDGQRFVPLNDLLSSEKLPNAQARLMIADQQGRLWIRFVKNGLYCLDQASQTITFYDEPFFREPLTMHPAACMDAQGNIWFSGLKGLACFRVANNTFEWFPIPQNEDGEPIEVYTCCQAQDGNLWVGASKKLYHFNQQTHAWTLHQHLPDLSDHLGLLPDNDGSIWISDWYQKSGGLKHYDPQQKRFLQVFSAHPEHPDSIPSTDFQGFFNEQERIWFATNDAGLVSYEKATGRFQRFQPNPRNANSFSEMQAQSVTRDIFGNLWAGTSQFLNRATAAPKMATHFAPAQGLVSAFGTVTAVVGPDKIVLGTGSGLSLYDARTGATRNVNLPLFNKNTYNNYILSAAPCDANSFWVSTWSTISRIDLQSGRVMEYFVMNRNAGSEHPPGRLYPEIGTAGRICRDGQGNLWMNPLGNLRKLSRRENGRVEFVEVALSPLLKGNSQPAVISFLPIGERLLYIGTNEGVLCYDVLSGEMRLLPLVFPGLEAAQRVTDLALDKNGKILAVVNHRLFRFDPEHPEQAAALIPLDFPALFPTGLAVDAQNNIWLASEIGLVRVDSKSNISTLYDPRYHLNGNYFSFIRLDIGQDSGGKLYFAGNTGITIVDPGAITTGNQPSVKIVSLKINNEQVALGAAIHRKGEINLAYDQNNIVLDFSVLNSDVPDLNRFAYHLEGVSSEWVDLDHQSSLNLVNLAPGVYTLHLRGANSDGVWAEAATPLRIIIRSPWWATWWALLAYVLLGAIGLYRLYTFRMRRFMLEQTLAAESRERERLAALDTFKSRFFTNISHEFRTPLTVILGLSERWSNAKTRWEESEVRHSLSLIQRSGENLLRLIAEILDLARLENNALKMNYIKGNIAAYLHYISESMHSLAAMRQVRLRVDCREREMLMDYDPERLLQVVYNLLSNAIKFTPPGGEVLLRAQVGGAIAGAPALELCVQDTGAGIPKDQLAAVFDRFFQAENQQYAQSGGTGVGLSLTRELVRAMGGTIAVDSLPGQGTTFTVLLPIHHNAPLSETPNNTVPAFPRTDAAAALVLPALQDESLPQLLLVEDNPDVMAYLVSCLQDSYRLELAWNGREGIEKALELVPDLIVSDVMMPEKDGLELCDTLKNDERTSHIPIVLLTAKADIESRMAGLRRGADVYLSKPFHPEELHLVLHNLQVQRRKWQERLGALTHSETTAPTEALSPEQAIENAFLQKLVQHIETRLDDSEFDGPRLAQQMLLSEVQLYRKIKALTGKSTAIYIRSVRLSKARELLRSTTLSVSEIAYQVGFEDPNYFSRTFSQEFGQAPSEMRK